MSFPFSNRALLSFTCGNCAFREDIGVGFNSGVILRGELTLVCPKCGKLHLLQNVLVVMDPMILSRKDTRGQE